MDYVQASDHVLVLVYSLCPGEWSHKIGSFFVYTNRKGSYFGVVCELTA